MRDGRHTPPSLSGARVDAALLRSIVQGSATAVVNTVNGPVPSAARRLAEAAARINYTTKADRGELRNYVRDDGLGLVYVLGEDISGDGGGGAFHYDPSDTTTGDDGVSVLVGPDGARWKRLFDRRSGVFFPTLFEALAAAASGGIGTGLHVEVLGHAAPGDGGAFAGRVEATDDPLNPAGGRILPLDAVVVPKMFGSVEDRRADDRAALQRMLDFCGVHGRRHSITGIHGLAGPLYINHHMMEGTSASASRLVYTGTGAAIRSNRVRGIYPVSCDLTFTVELTAPGQICWDWQLSYSKGRLNATMNAPACANCAGMRLLGDVSNGSGSYYNRIELRGQAAHQPDTHLIRTEPDNGDFTATRGPNGNTVHIVRAGQYNAALLDRVGNGNTYTFQTVEGDGQPGRNAILAGHRSTRIGLNQNTYRIEYLENVEYGFRSLPGTFGVANAFEITMLTGGGAILDEANVLTSVDGIRGFLRPVTLNAPFALHSAAGRYPVVRGAGSPGLDFHDTGSGNFLRLLTSHGFAIGSHAARLFVGAAEFLRAGVAGLYPAGDNTRSLGSAGDRWTQLFAVAGAINTSDAREKRARKDEEAEILTLATAIASVPIHAYQWRGSVAEKGEDEARVHVGVYAQEVEAAIRAAGLDPARYAIWCRDALTEVVEIEGEDGTVTGETRPVLDADGTPAYRLGIRHDQLAALSLFALRLADARRAEEIGTLTARVEALEGGIR